MYNINLILTRHYECGNCNSNELYKIIESVNPEIIFEELSSSNFHKSYKEENLVTLETNAVKMYLQDYPIEHIPVDTFDLPISYEEDRDSMYSKIFANSAHNETQTLHNLIDKQVAYESKYGFRFLNSKCNDELFEKLSILKELILNQLNDDRLFLIFKLEKEVIEKRENEMLTNIYRHSKEHQYHRGLFFIGSGHRESILQKIGKYKAMENLKLNWIVYDSEDF